jgi:hypothetical protein
LLIEGGAQGDTIVGMHAPGVFTPIAAAVAAITVGLSGALHITKDGMFNIGTISVISAAGIELKCNVLPGSGKVMNGMGTVPIEQVNRQPIVRYSATP